jgi:CRP/FNR family transcriptional regulator, cyclic AMP receptor protein
MPRRSTLELVRSLKSLGWLSGPQLERLTNALSVRIVDRHEIILDENSAPADETQILLSGMARLTCLNARKERVLVALLSPGIIPRFPLLSSRVQSDFRYEAFTDCKVGGLKSELLTEIVLGVRFSEFTKLARAMAGPFPGMLARYSSFVGLDLEQRIAASLLELSSSFGVRDSRGMLLNFPLTHADLAKLVGASRPKVTEHLAKLEKRQAILRDGRRLVLVVSRLQALLNEPQVRHVTPGVPPAAGRKIPARDGVAIGRAAEPDKAAG